ncbi:MAG TPA: caspase family protein [Trichocoleus sp.]|jgi:WD40 repeat protein/energy-coupling factor transporter ATP-binding protein EcfA2
MKRYALVIGIGKYTNLNELSKPGNDARAVAEVLRQYGGFQEVTLLNGTKTKPGWVDYDTLDQELTKFLKQAANQDVLIYFTGHGFTLEESRFVKRGYLATSSCKVKFKDKRIISQEEGFSFDDLNGLVQEVNLSSLLMLMDCCHSGFLIEDDLVKKSLQAFSKSNYFLIAACRSFQEAYALKRGSYSVFTGALLESLSQENARQGVVTALNVLDFIDRELKGSGQEPIFLGMGGAIPIVSYEVITEAPLDNTCPYQGLEAFTEATAQFFFGRQKDVETLWQKLEQSAFVPVIGASGSGKSSLVRAGLIPALKQSGTNWTVLEPIKPGEEPLAQLRQPLEELVRQIPGKVQLGTLIRKAPEGVKSLIEQIPEGMRFLLVVDQFEEVFTVCLDEEERSRFIHLITQVNAIPNSQLTVVITMRADFVESCLCYESLKTLIQDQGLYLSQLTGADLTDAIAKPAAKQGYSLTSDLLAEIVKDTREEPGFLPLLQFALTKLWEPRDEQTHQLTLDSYWAIGKLVGALNSHAEQIYTCCDYIDPDTGEINLSAQQNRSQSEQDWIRAILLRLVRTSEAEKDTRQRQLRSTLIAVAGETLEAHQQIGLVLESLIKGRLLVSERETVDLAHEALIKGWKRLDDWCQESRELRRLSQRLEAARLEWEKDQQNPSLTPAEKDRNLMMGGLLAEVREQWEALVPYLQDFGKDEPFWQRSDAHEKDRIAQLQQALTKAEQRQVEVEQLEIRSLCKSSESLLAISKEFDALLDSLKAVNRLSKATWVNSKIKEQVRLTLQRAIYSVSEYNRLEGHNDTVRSVCFNPDGTMIASAGYSGMIKLWKIDGCDIKTFRGHNAVINSICFSPDGKMLASAGSDSTIRLWDLTGQEITFFSDESVVVSICFNPKGTMLVSASWDGSIKLWNLEGQRLKSFKGHDSWINRIAFHPGGKILASASEDKTVKLWDLNGRQLNTLAHKDCVKSVKFSPNGKHIASGGNNRTVKIFSMEGEELQLLKGHTGWIMDVSFSPDGTMVASSSGDTMIKVWNLNGQEIKTFKGHSDWVSSVNFSPDDKTLVSASGDGTIRLWSTVSQELNTLKGHTNDVISVRFSPDGKTIASAGHDNTIKLWTREGKEIETLVGHDGWVRDISFSPDGKVIASISNDTTIKLWSLKGQELKTFTGHNEWGRSVSFSPVGDIIVSASWDKTLRVWNLQGQELHVLKGHHEGVLGVSFSSSGEVFASASVDRTIKLWSIDGRELKTLVGHSGRVNMVTFSPDGKMIASASMDKTIKLWDLRGQELKTVEGHTGSVYCVSFSPDGQTIASGSGDKTIKLWNLKGQELKTLEGHSSEVNSVSFSPDGRVLASASTDNLIKLWNATTLDFEGLIDQGCSWVQDYLRTNPNIEEVDRHLCSGIVRAKE